MDTVEVIIRSRQFVNYLSTNAPHDLGIIMSSIFKQPRVFKVLPPLQQAVLFNWTGAYSSIQLQNTTPSTEE